MAAPDNNSSPGIKAIDLLSGGLDSTLAVRIVKERGIDVLALNFVSPFCLCNKKKGCRNIAKLVGRRLGVQVRTISLSKEYIEVLRNPKYGYGSNLNPCLDCRILMFKHAKRCMERTGASFIITGEVLDQRPMSQHARAWSIIEREAQVEGLVVRPLSGGLLPPTLPEKVGLVKREWLLRIRGRSRKPQMQIADAFGIDYYPCPAGGCLLTDPSFAPRVRDLLTYVAPITVNDLRLLRYGRHFRLSPFTKAIVGRCEKENLALESLARKDDLVLQTLGCPGPLTVVRGCPTPKDIDLASRIHARFTDRSNGGEVCVGYRLKGQSVCRANYVKVTPAAQEEIERLRI